MMNSPADNPRMGRISSESSSSHVDPNAKRQIPISLELLLDTQSTPHASCPKARTEWRPGEKRSHPGCKLKESFPQMMVGEGLIWIFLLACGAAKSYVMIASAIALFA